MKTLFLAFFFCSFSVFAQNPAFKVLITEGKHKIGQNEFITIGTEVTENQPITFENGYLVLIDPAGKTIELTEKGVYQIADLKAKTTAETNTLWKQYNQKDYFSTAKRELRLKRASGDSQVSGAVTVCMPKTSVAIYNNHLILNWFVSDSTKTNFDTQHYEVYLTDLADQVLQIHKTPEKEASIQIQDSLFVKSFNKIIYKIIAVDKKNQKNANVYAVDGFVVERLDPAMRRKIAQEIKQIENPNCPVLSLLVQANYFEEKDLLIDARLAYQKLLAIKDLEVFRTFYQNFLYRNCLTKESYLVKE